LSDKGRRLDIALGVVTVLNHYSKLHSAVQNRLFTRSAGDGFRLCLICFLALILSLKAKPKSVKQKAKAGFFDSAKLKAKHLQTCF
jgi:hypothetical protein